jgi:hypothetical protein
VQLRPALIGHASRALLVNSGPLSQTIITGAPRSATSSGARPRGPCCYSRSSPSDKRVGSAFECESIVASSARRSSVIDELGAMLRLWRHAGVEASEPTVSSHRHEIVGCLEEPGGEKLEHPRQAPAATEGPEHEEARALESRASPGAP